MGEEPIIIIDNIKKKSPLKIIVIVIASIIALYVLMAVFFSYNYSFNTVIAGKNRSFQSKSKVYNEFCNSNANIPVVFIGRHDGEVKILPDEYIKETHYDLSVLEKPSFNDGIFWIANCIKGKQINIKCDVDIDKELFTEALEKSVLCAPKLVKKPQDAYLDGYNRKTKEFEIKAGDPGNILDIDVVTKVVSNSLKEIDADAKEVRIDLIENDCYTKALVSTNNAKLVAEKQKADKMLSTKVFYDWNGARVVVDDTVIKDMLVVKDERVILDEKKVEEFVTSMAEKHDTFGKPMKFKTSLGKSITIQRGDYGWKTNVEKEIPVLIEDIKNGVQCSKEPEYKYKGYAKGQNDVGRSYVEVDLSNQHVYLYIKGKMVLESDCVTGNMSQGHKTPEGIYGITYKTTNATLRGPGYASFVNYWMPYCGGVGLHDATWRNKFGGEIYKTAGSHGCVNLPKGVAKNIYENVETNFPVVSYW